MDQMTIKDSREVYILKKAQWVMLLNPKKWKYSEPHYNAKLGRIMDTISWENEFLNQNEELIIDLIEDFSEEARRGNFKITKIKWLEHIEKMWKVKKYPF